MSLRLELRSIREQMKSDFEAVMSGLATQRDAVNRALEEQERLLKGFVSRTDERMEKVLDVVERHEDTIDDLIQRVEALEKKQPPAA